MLIRQRQPYPLQHFDRKDLESCCALVWAGSNEHVLRRVYKRIRSDCIHCYTSFVRRRHNGMLTKETNKSYSSGQVRSFIPSFIAHHSHYIIHRAISLKGEALHKSPSVCVTLSGKLEYTKQDTLHNYRVCITRLRCEGMVLQTTCCI